MMTLFSVPCYRLMVWVRMVLKLSLGILVSEPTWVPLMSMDDSFMVTASACMLGVKASMVRPLFNSRMLVNGLEKWVVKNIHRLGIYFRA